MWLGQGPILGLKRTVKSLCFSIQEGHVLGLGFYDYPDPRAWGHLMWTFAPQLGSGGRPRKAPQATQGPGFGLGD